MLSGYNDCRKSNSELLSSLFILNRVVVLCCHRFPHALEESYGANSTSSSSLTTAIASRVLNVVPNIVNPYLSGPRYLASVLPKPILFGFFLALLDSDPPESPMVIMALQSQGVPGSHVTSWPPNLVIYTWQHRRAAEGDNGGRF